MRAKKPRKPSSRDTLPLKEGRAKMLHRLQQKLRVRFSNVSLLNLALAHKSYANEHKFVNLNNERLELLGDAVLGLVISDRLYRLCNNKNEGYLAKCKAHIVSEKTVAAISGAMSIDTYLLVGKGEEMSGGRKKTALLCDAMEAIIGAYYLDSGFQKANEMVLRLFNPEIAKVLNNEHAKDYKTMLQEYVQHTFKSYPKYKVVKRSGPEHKQIFWVNVTIEKRTYGPASGLNRKGAEQSVAQVAYLELTGGTGQ